MRGLRWISTSSTYNTTFDPPELFDQTGGFHSDAAFSGFFHGAAHERLGRPSEPAPLQQAHMVVVLTGGRRSFCSARISSSWVQWDADNHIFAGERATAMASSHS